MNRIFKVIWNHQLQRKVVASELAQNYITSNSTITSNQLSFERQSGLDNGRFSHSYRHSKLCRALLFAGLILGSSSLLFAESLDNNRLQSITDQVIQDHIIATQEVDDQKQFADVLMTSPRYIDGNQVTRSEDGIISNQPITKVPLANQLATTNTIKAPFNVQDIDKRESIDNRAVITDRLDLNSRYYSSGQTVRYTANPRTTLPGKVGLDASVLSNSVMKNPQILKLGNYDYHYMTFLFRPEFYSATANDINANFDFFVYNSPEDSTLILYKGKYDPTDPGYGALEGNDDDDESIMYYRDLFGLRNSDLDCGSFKHYCPGISSEVENGSVYTVWVSAYDPKRSEEITSGNNSLIVGSDVKGASASGQIGSFAPGDFTTITPKTGSLKPWWNKESWWNSYDIGFYLDPIFEGGTLRLWKSEGLGYAANIFNMDQKFFLSSNSDNTLNTNGKNATFNGVWQNLNNDKGVIRFINETSTQSTLIFNQNNTFTGGATIGDGVNVIVQGGDSAFGQGFIVVDEGGSFRLEQRDSYLLPNQFKGKGDVTISLNDKTQTLQFKDQVDQGDFAGRFVLERGALIGDNLSILDHHAMHFVLEKDGALTVNQRKEAGGQLTVNGGAITLTASRPLTVSQLTLGNQGAQINLTLDKEGIKRAEDNLISQSQSNHKNYVVQSNQSAINNSGVIRSTIKTDSNVIATDNRVTLTAIDNGFGEADLKAIYDLSGNQVTLDERGIGYSIRLLELESRSNALLSAQSLTGLQKMEAKLTGTGGYTYEGNSTGLILTNHQNDYQGASVVRAGRVIAGTDQSLGNSHTLKIQDNASFDLHNYTQTIGSLKLERGELLFDGGTLTLNQYSESLGSITGRGTINLNDQLTLKKSADLEGRINIGQNGFLLMYGDAEFNKSDLKIINNSHRRVSFNNSGNVTFKGELSGTGALNVYLAENATLTLLGKVTTSENSHLITLGHLQVGNGLQQATLQGNVEIENAKSSLIFNQGALQTTTFNEVISGLGQLENRSGILHLTANNSYSGGTKITEGQIVINKIGALGDGAVYIGNQGTLFLDRVDTQQFDKPLTGSGLFKVQGVGQTTAFTFTPYVGNQFKGAIEFNDLKFSVSRRNNGVIGRDNNLQLNNTLLVIDQNLSAKNVVIGSGSTLKLFGTLTKEPKAAGVLEVNDLQLKGGQIEIAIDGEIKDEPGYGPIKDGYTLDPDELFIRGTKKKHTLTLVKSNNSLSIDSVILNGQRVDVSSNADGTVEFRSDFKQGGQTVATAKYGEGVTTEFGREKGIFLISGLYGIKIHDDKVLKIDSVKAYEQDSFSVLLTGEGSLELNASNANMNFGNEANDYRGDTTITHGAVTLASSSAFGVDGNLSVNSGASLNLNGYQQTVDQLNNQGQIHFVGEESALILQQNSTLGLMTGSAGVLILKGGEHLMNQNNPNFTNQIDLQKGAILQIATTQTLKNKLKGEGALKINADTLLAGNNHQYSGSMMIADQKTLSMTSIEQLGNGKVHLEGPNSILDMMLGNTVSIFNNQLSGTGKIKVQGEVLIAEADNSHFKGQWSIADNGILTINQKQGFGESTRVQLAKDAYFAMNYAMGELSADIQGVGTLSIGEKGDLSVTNNVSSKVIDDSVNIHLSKGGKFDYHTSHFNHTLTGDGILNIDAANQNLILGQRVGNQFSGDLTFTNAILTFANQGESQWNKNAVEKSALSLQNSAVTIAQDMDVRALTLGKDAHLFFKGDLAKNSVDGAINVRDQLMLTEGVISLEIAGLGGQNGSDTIQAEEMDLFALGSGSESHLNFITSGTLDLDRTEVILNGNRVELNGTGVEASRTRLQQKHNGVSEEVADLYFGNRVTTDRLGESGLYLTSGLSRIDLLKDQQLSVHGDDANTHFSVLVTGSGDLALSGQMLFGNEKNSYQGDTLVDAGVVKLATDNAFGQSGQLIISDSATVDLNGKSQVIDALENVGSLYFNNGQLTIQKDSVLAGLSGSGSLIIAGGTSTVNSESNGFSAIVEVKEGAELTLNNAQTVNNQLTGKGKINITKAVALSNINNSFAGLLNVTDNHSLTINDIRQLGEGTLLLNGQDAILNLNFNLQQSASLNNTLTGNGIVNVNGNTALLANNSAFEGNFNIANERELAITQFNQLGSASINLSEEKALLRVTVQNGETEGANWHNKITGLGSVMQDAGKIHFEEHNETLSDYEGHWRIGGEGLLHIDNGAHLGDTAFEVLGTLKLQNDHSTPFTFDQRLTGNGLVAVQGNEQQLILGEKVGDQFTGNLDLSTTKFVIDQASSAQLQQATLTLNQDSIATIADGNQQMGDIELTGGTLEFNVAQKIEEDEDKLIYAKGTLTAKEFIIGDASNTIHIVGPKEIGIPEIPQSEIEDLSIFELDDGKKIANLIVADKIIGNSSYLQLEINDGGPIEDRVVPLTQRGTIAHSNGGNRVDIEPAAKGYFNYGIAVERDNDANKDQLGINYKLVRLALVGEGDKAFILGLSKDAAGEDTDLSAQITGSGDLILDEPEDKYTVASFSNIHNNYTGKTSIKHAALRLDGDGVLGKTSLLDIGEEGSVDLNGKVQTIGALQNRGTLILDNISGEDISEENIEGNIKGSTRLTIKNSDEQSSTLGLVTGIGSIILSQGSLTVDHGGAEAGAHIMLDKDATANIDVESMEPDQKATIFHAFAGEGEINVKHGNAVFVADNSAFTGHLSIDNGQSLTVSQVNQLGSGKAQQPVNIEGTLYLSNFNSKEQIPQDEIQQQFSGSGSTYIQGGEVYFSADNSEYKGQYHLVNGGILVLSEASQIGSGNISLEDESYLKVTGDVGALSNQFQGSGQIEIQDGAAIELTNHSFAADSQLAPKTAILVQGDLKLSNQDDKPYHFDQALTGAGKVTVDGNSQYLILGEAVGDQFSGTLALEKTQFELSSESRMLHQTALQLGKESSTTVVGEVNQLSSLDMAGGELHFSGSLNRDEATSILTHQWNVTEESDIYLTIDGLAPSLKEIDEQYTDQLHFTQSTLFERFNGNQTLTFITLNDMQNHPTIEGDRNLLNVYINGESAESLKYQSTSQVIQNINGVDTHNADISFGYNIDTSQGLTLTTADVTQLHLLGKAESAFTMMADKDQVFRGVITGEGDLKLGTRSGHTLSLNKENQYVGNTYVTDGNILANANNIFGLGGDLTISQASKVDLNGHSQVVDRFENQGILNLNSGELTIRERSLATGLMGEGVINVASDALSITKDASNLGLAAQWNIQEDGQLYVANYQALGSGDIRIYKQGILNLDGNSLSHASSESRLENTLKGEGFINIQGDTQLMADNRDFIGQLTVMENAALTISNSNQLGNAELQRAVQLDVNSTLNLVDFNQEDIIGQQFIGDGTTYIQGGEVSFSADNRSNYQGDYRLTDGGVLTISDLNQIGAGKIVFEAETALNVIDKVGDLSNQFSGPGQITIQSQGVLGLTNQSFEDNSTTLRVDGELSLLNQSHNIYTFNQKLSGAGKINVNGNHQLFELGKEVAENFEGALYLTDAEFKLKSQDSQLANSRLQLGLGSTTTVLDNGNTLTALEMQGGVLNLSKPFAPNQSIAVLDVQTLDLSQGKINLSIDGLGEMLSKPQSTQDLIAQSNGEIQDKDIDLFELGSGAINKVTFIKADQLQGTNETEFTLNGQSVVLNGIGSDQSRTRLNQAGDYVADLVYSSNVVTTSIGKEQGLFVTSGLTLVDIQKDRTLDLVNKRETMRDFTVQVVGDGGISLSGNMGFGHDGNSYRGKTTLMEFSDITLLHNNALGKGGSVELKGGSQLNLAGKSQKSGDLINNGLVNIGSGGSLSINQLINHFDAQNPENGLVNLQGGHLIIRNENQGTSYLTGLTGSGVLVLAGGVSKVTGVNNGLKAAIEIQQNATVDLLQESGLGEGVITVAGQLNIGDSDIKEHHLMNQLKGNGRVSILSAKTTLTADNRGFSGEIEIVEQAGLVVSHLNQLGQGNQGDDHRQKAIILDGHLTLEGISEAEGMVTQNLKGKGTLNLVKSDIVLESINQSYEGAIILDQSQLKVGYDYTLGNASLLALENQSHFNLNNTTQHIDKITISEGSHFAGTGMINGQEIINYGTLQVGHSEIDLSAGLGGDHSAARSVRRKSILQGETDHLILKTNNGHFKNHGFIQLAGNIVGNTLTIHGNYSGEGAHATILMNVDRTSEGYAADQLYIKGKADGHTMVFVRDVNQRLENMKRDQLLLITTEGSTDDAFKLGNAVLSGNYQYQLLLENDDWYLKRDGYRADIGSNMANTLTATQFQVPGFGGPILGGSLTGGTGGLRSLARLQVGSLTGEGDWGSGSIWNTTSGGKYRDRKVLDHMTYDSDFYSTTFGGDYLFPVGDYTIQAGAMFSMLKAKNTSHTLEHSLMGLDDNISKGHLNGHIYSFYGTWFLDPQLGGLSPYIDGVVSYGHYRNKIETEGNPEDRYRSHVWSFTLQGGYPIDLGNNVVLEPQAQLTYLDFNARAYTDAGGTSVKQSLEGNIVTRVGLFAYPKEGDIRPYAGINLWYDGIKAAVTSDGERIEGHRAGWMLEAKAGIGAILSEDLTLSADLFYRKGRHKMKDYGGGVTVKYRIPQKGID